jgi:hypothetical protein
MLLLIQSWMTISSHSDLYNNFFGEPVVFVSLLYQV